MTPVTRPGARAANRVRCLALMIVQGILTAPAHADTTSDVLKAFGLRGVWARDCRQPASQDNPRVSYAFTRKGVDHRVSFDGRSAALTDTAADGVNLSPDAIRFSVVRHGRLSLVVTLHRDGNTIWTTDSVGADGTIYYADGIEVATGKPSMVFERCDVQPIS